MIEEPSAVETTSRPDPGGTLAIAAAETLLVLVAFTSLLASRRSGIGLVEGRDSLSGLGPSLYMPYSPNDVKDAFPEVHIHDPAWLKVL